MNTPISKPVFTDTELPVEEPIRPFRPSGLVSFFLGVISVGALASVSLLVIPVLAVVFGLVALRPAKDRTVRPSGQGLACVGIVLAILFGTWSWGYAQVRESVLVSSGSRFAVDWLNTLRYGETEFAFELTQPASTRQLGSMSLPDYYSESNQIPYEQFSSFLSQAMTKAVLESETDPDWVFDQVVASNRIYDSDYISVRLIDRSGALQPVQVTLCRTPTFDDEGLIMSDGPNQWHVSDFQLVANQ
jgi:hypothetical protein